MASGRYTVQQAFNHGSTIDQIVQILANGMITPVLILSTSDNVSKVTTKRNVNSDGYHLSEEVWQLQGIGRCAGDLTRTYEAKRLPDRTWSTYGNVKSNFVSAKGGEKFVQIPDGVQMTADWQISFSPIVSLAKDALERSLRSDCQKYLIAIDKYVHGDKDVDFFIKKAGNRLSAQQREQAIFADRYLKENGILKPADIGRAAAYGTD